MSLKVKVLEAFNGDSILINYDNRNILIDGGIGRTYYITLRDEIIKIKERGEHLDLLVVTHIDDDHIGGIIKLFEDDEVEKSIIKKVWFNSEILMSKFLNDLQIEPQGLSLENNDSNKMSVQQGITLEKMLMDLNCWEQTLISFGESFVNYQLMHSKLTVLTPRYDSIIRLKKRWERDKPESNKMSSCKEDYNFSIEELATRDFKEDDSITNKSSISFIFEYKNKQILFLGDSHPSDVVISLKELGYSKEKKLKVDYVKLSHHGSKGNTSNNLLEILDCQRYIISTDGSKHCLPNKESLARIATSKKEEKVYFYFNYPIHDAIFNENEMEKYDIECVDINELEV